MVAAQPRRNENRQETHKLFLPRRRHLSPSRRRFEVNGGDEDEGSMQHLFVDTDVGLCTPARVLPDAPGGLMWRIFLGPL